MMATRSTLTVTDNRTGHTIEVPIVDNAVRATHFAKLLPPADRRRRRALENAMADGEGEGATTAGTPVGLRLLDRGLANTAVVASAVSRVDGARGVLTYRGYRVEDLVNRCSFLDVAHLLILGELPDGHRRRHWRTRVMRHTFVHEDCQRMMTNFRYDAHPMGMLMSSVAALSTFYPEANPALEGADVLRTRPSVRHKQTLRLLGKVPTLAAMAYRRRQGRPYNYPVPGGELGYVENFLQMLNRIGDFSSANYKADPNTRKLIEALFILHAAPGGLDSSTAAVRHLASADADPYTAVAGGLGCLFGPTHGGEAAAVARMLDFIKTADRVKQFVANVKAGKVVPAGFGHAVFAEFDPRARVLRGVLDWGKNAAEIEAQSGHTGKSDTWKVAKALLRVAASDPFFKANRLFPNLSFFTGLIFHIMNIPTDMFVVLEAIPRTVGWLAHYVEAVNDRQRRLVTPQQIYVGSGMRKVGKGGGQLHSKM